MSSNVRISPAEFVKMQSLLEKVAKIDKLLEGEESYMMYRLGKIESYAVFERGAIEQALINYREKCQKELQDLGYGG